MSSHTISSYAIVFQAEIAGVKPQVRHRAVPRIARRVRQSTARSGCATKTLPGFLAGADFLPAAGATVGLQDFFAEADGFGRDFHEFVVGDEFDGLLQAQFLMRDEANGFVGAGRAHVGLLLFLGNVDVHILLAGILAEDHAFIDLDGRADEELAALLNIPQRERGRNSGTVRDERASGAQGHFAGIIHPAIENGVNQRGPARIREQLAAQADQAARGDFEIEAHAAGIVIAHLEHFATTAADSFENDADEVFRDVDHQPLERLQLAAVFSTHHDFGFADHQLETFAAHRFDQDGELQFATAENAKRFRRIGIFDANRNVGEQLFLQPVAKITRSEIAAFFAGKRAAVHRENHCQGRLVDQQRLERLRIGEINDAFADLNALDASDGHQVSGENAFGFVAFEPAKSVELGDAGGIEFAVELADADFGAALDGAVEHAADGDAAEKIAVIEIHYLDLQDAIGIAGRRRDGFDDGLEERE